MKTAAFAGPDLYPVVTCLHCGSLKLTGTWSGENGADGILVESTDTGEAFEAISYPGEPEEVVLAWTALDGAVLAGTNDGRLISRDSDGTWTDVGQVPAGIRSLESY